MRNASIRLGTGLVALALVGTLQVPSSASERPARTNTASPSGVTPVKRVKIVDFAFDPARITIARGTRVRWTNAGSARHTSTSNTGVWNSGPIAPGASFSRLFKRAGTFRYHCAFHTQMHGKIVVT